MSVELLKDEKVIFDLNKNYNVIIHNDDKTTFDCVIGVLINVFNFSDQNAFFTTLAVHKMGSAIVGTYSKDIAETKKMEAIDLAREEGYPLMLTVEEA